MFCASYVPSKCLKGASKVLQRRLQSEAVTQGHSCLGSLSSCPNIVTIPSQVTAKLVKMPADQWWQHSTACLSCRTFQWHAIAELMDKLNFNYYSGQVEDQSRINTKDILGIGRGGCHQNFQPRSALTDFHRCQVSSVRCFGCS